ncbi:MAG: hypothetical protein WC476_01615 [Phycisphaerae bacterium]|jgi:hypothetical protein
MYNGKWSIHREDQGSLSYRSDAIDIKLEIEEGVCTRMEIDGNRDYGYSNYSPRDLKDILEFLNKSVGG